VGLTPHCASAAKATGAFALEPRALEELHASCPGGYVTRDGKRHGCGCSCHVPVGVPLPVVDDAPQGRKPAGPAKRSRVDENNHCEHCGAPCKRRFVVGHDAKLKSELARAIRAGGDEATKALAECIARGEAWVPDWTNEDLFPAASDLLAAVGDRQYLEDRNRVRKARYSPN